MVCSLNSGYYLSYPGRPDAAAFVTPAGINFLWLFRPAAGAGINFKSHGLKIKRPTSERPQQVLSEVSGIESASAVFIPA
jgi:hypothetical protein